MRSLRPQQVIQSYGDLVEVWERFASWGETICQKSNQTCRFDEDSTDWDTVRQILGAFEQLIQHEAARVDSLLEQCDARFHPLADPLRLTLTDHRWFDPERVREENYSDWLCWLITHLDSTEQILGLFALEGTEFGGRAQHQKPEIAVREECIRAAGGEKKRLDLVVRFDEGCLLLVEVKIHKLDQTGRNSLPFYVKWLKEEQPDQRLRAAVLLLQNQDESIPTDWTTRVWSDVAGRLRRLAPELYGREPAGLMRGAMMLAFAGAVEQNLLGLSPSASGSSAPQTTLYLERFLQELKS